MNVKFYRNRMANGFRKQVTASGSRVTLPRSKGKDLLDYKIKQRSEKCVTIGGVEYGVADNITLHESVANGSNAMVDTGVNCSDDMEFFCRFKCNTLDSLYLLQRRSTLNPSINGLTGSNNGAKIALGFCGQNVVSDITRTVGHIYAIKGTVLNGTLTLYVKDETTGTEDTKTGTYTVGTLPTDNVTMFGNAKGDNLASGNVVYEAYIKINGSYAWYIIGDYDVIGKSVITATRGTLTAGKTTKTVEVSGQSIEVPLFHYRGVGDYGGKRNQLVRNGNFESTSGWSYQGGVVTVENNMLSLICNETSHPQVYRDTSVVASHKYLYTVDLKSSSPIEQVRMYLFASPTVVAYKQISSANVWTELSEIVDVATTGDFETNIYIQSEYISLGITIQYRNFMLIDLTAMFPNETITDVATAKARIAEVMGGQQEYYPYDAGTDYYKIPEVVTSGGCVDLGTLNWTYVEEDTRFYCHLSSTKGFPSGSVANAFCKLYQTVRRDDTPTIDMSISINEGSVVNIHDNRFADVDSLKAALSGVYLYYQRDTDDSFSVNHYHVYTDEQGFSCGAIADEVSYLNGDVLNIGHATLSEGTHSLTGAKSNGAYITNIPSSGTLSGTSIIIPSGYGDVEVLYELATPVTKQIVAPTVQTALGDMHFEVETETAPSGVEIIGRSGVA